MRLRSNKALKFFAILLFSFEMTAPALIPAIGDDVNSVRQDRGQRSYSNASPLTTFIYSLIFEENNGEGEGEEERESKDHKFTICFSDFGFAEAYITLITTETRHIAWAEPYETTATQPPLFTLFHTYLI